MCNILKTTNGTNINWYKYKNGKLYSTCIECFNKKVKCEFCNKEFNKTYLSKHLKRCNKLLEDVYYLNKDDDNENQIDDDNNQPDDNQIDDNDSQIDDNNNQIDTATLALHNNCNRTLIVGPSFCGKTHLLLNKLQLIRLDDNTRKIHIFTRSPEQYSNTALLASGIEIEDISVDEDLEDRTIQDFKIVVLYLMICWTLHRN